MSECEESKTSEIVESVRDLIRKDIHEARSKHRHDEIDGLRVAPNELLDYSINLQSFDRDDVLNIVKTIKKNKRAKTVELLKLSHAFLQNSNNIQAFLNTTGAINVLVKELTGSDSEKQVLAVECLCNLSLGSEVLCEKVVLQSGTYLHTFMQSSNESLQRTSLWCLTNLIAAGERPLALLLHQELVTGLINLNKNTHSESIRKESYAAIELLIAHCNVSTFRSSDMETLSQWIQQQGAPLDPESTPIIYRFLDKLEFKSNDSHAMQKLLTNCFDTLVLLSEGSESDSRHIILLVRICSNIIATEKSLGDFIVRKWFLLREKTISTFFDSIIRIVKGKENLSANEVYWFINNIISAPLSDGTSKLIDLDALIADIE